jgi:diadenosine tetraphosphatase ApaH/serine/threonine PP2A family protein phosphatase
VLFVNVGSVGRPKDGDARAMYTVVHVEPELPVDVEDVRVGYDVEAVARAILEVGLPPELAEAIRQGR